MGAGEALDRDPRIGVAVDKYVIVRPLGRGGMGAVYEARHAHLERRVAIKFLLPELAANPEALRRFENEAKAAGRLEHPNLVAVTDVGRTADGAPYLVMEYLDGEDCARLLRRLGPLPVPRAVDIIAQACRGLAVAHRSGIVHRDLKPENLFVTDAGDGCDLLKVLDFGIAKLRGTEAGAGTKTGATFGTPHYMSPEQARGAADLDERTDVWSLGVVLYELLTGRKPFEGDQFLEVVHRILGGEAQPLASVRPGLPPRLVAVAERAMARDLALRFPSVTSLAEALGPLTGRTPGAGRVAGPGEATLPTPATGAAPAAGSGGAAGAATTARMSRSPARLIAIVVAALAVGAAATFVTLRLRMTPASVPPPPPIERAPPPAPVSPAPAVIPVPARPTSETSEQASNQPPRQPAHRSRKHVRAPKAARPTPVGGAPAGNPVNIETSNPY